MTGTRAEFGIEWCAPVSLAGDDLLRWRGRLCAPPLPRGRRHARILGVVLAVAVVGGASSTIVPGELGHHDARLVPTTVPAASPPR
jgi:hypothetical protein